MRVKIFKAIGLTTAGIALGWTIALAQQPKQAPNVTSEMVTQESPLAMLDWIVGDWVNESGDSSIEFNCHFTKNGSFLVRSFKNVSTSENQMSGMQVIAWDPKRAAIRSWTFDSAGGFGEDTWSQSGNRYTIRATYTLPDGGTASAVNVFTFVDSDRCTWKSVSREIDGELQPDTDELVLVRKTSN